MKSQVPRAQKGNIMNTTSSRISVNAINSSIVVSKAFYKKACAYGTNEYTLLHKAMSENPAYQVVIAEVKKQAYSKLTFVCLVICFLNFIPAGKVIMKVSCISVYKSNIFISSSIPCDGLP